jgi:hypothetical protein
LDQAAKQVIDYLDAVDPSRNHSDWVATVLPDDVAMADEVAAARRATRDAAKAQEQAAVATRQVVSRLTNMGYKSADVAGVLGVTRARAYQLLKDVKVAS